MTPSKLKQELPPQAIAVSDAITDASPAANDDAIPAPASNDLRNPLWIIAIGMAWFFGSVAAVIALS
jgi:hypothetical protein